MKRNRSKLSLSREELGVLNEAEFFRQKRMVTEKIMAMLNEVKLAIAKTPAFRSASFPDGTDISNGKISRGENYLGLPYLILDFPRKFAKDDIAAFRTMVWWGRHFSFTFLKSVHGDAEAMKTARRLQLLRNKSVWMCINASAWHHHFGDDNYQRLVLIPQQKRLELIRQAGFVKVSEKYSLNRISRMADYAAESFTRFSKLL